MILIGDVYFSENNEVWATWNVIYDSFGDNDFLAYTLKWWIVLAELIRLSEE